MKTSINNDNRKKYMKKYNEEHKRDRAEYNKKYYKNNKKKCDDLSKKYSRSDKAKINKRAYYNKNKTDYPSLPDDIFWMIFMLVGVPDELKPFNRTIKRQFIDAEKQYS